MGTYFVPSTPDYSNEIKVGDWLDNLQEIVDKYDWIESIHESDGGEVIEVGINLNNFDLHTPADDEADDYAYAINSIHYKAKQMIDNDSYAITLNPEGEVFYILYSFVG